MKEIEAQNIYPYKFTKYTDGSVKALCIECNEEKTMPAATFDKFSRIPRDISRHWTEDFKCSDCFKKSNKSKKLLQPMDERELAIRTGQAINLAHAEWQSALEMGLPAEVDFGKYATERVPELLDIISKIQENQKSKLLD